MRSDHEENSKGFEELTLDIEQNKEYNSELHINKKETIQMDYFRVF